MKDIDENWAAKEARRCLLCDSAPCSCGCPAGVDPKRFIRKIRFGNMKGAVRELRRANVLAGCCSYICPCLNTCMGKCTSEKLDEPIDIIRLQRYVCEWERVNGMVEPEAAGGKGSKVAIIGSGPAGLACSAELAVRGHVPVVFDSAMEPGGMLRQVIPDFRLPRHVLDFDIDFIRKLGVTFELEKMINEPSKLLGEFKAVFISTGMPVPKGAGLNGEDKKGVLQALDFLRSVKAGVSNESMKGKRVVVIGGGDTAIDSARVCARTGAGTVLAYRRTRADMPAYRPDIDEAEKEGVELMFRTLPRAIIGEGAVTGLKAVKIRWKSTGRAADGYTVEGTEFLIPCDIVIIAVGQGPATLFGLRTGPGGYISVDKNMMTSTPGIFAGGDIVTGPSTAVAAVGAGRMAAGFMHEYLK